MRPLSGFMKTEYLIVFNQVPKGVRSDLGVNVVIIDALSLPYVMGRALIGV
ncbi:hypothetical protein HanRHA438_Chr01g0030401 [Helianthus annuus]|nr:hypothetical protein HanRHA438_Chr01g0030401 [Helianthus annuus]